MASPPRAPSPDLNDRISEIEQRSHIPAASMPESRRQTYEANRLWFETIAVPKAIVREQFMKDVRKKQFKHIYQEEPRTPKPKGS